MSQFERKIDNIPREVLKRHYGIDDLSKLSNIQLDEINIGSIPGKLILFSAENKSDNKPLKIFSWESDDSSELGFPFTDNFELILNILNSLDKGNLGELELSIQKGIDGDFTNFTPISVDVTNLHFHVTTATELFRLKWYSRPEKGFREYQVHDLITDLNIAPQPVLMLNYENNAIFALYKEISNIDNLDTLTGGLYNQVLKRKIQIVDFYSRMNDFFYQIVDLLVKVMKLGEKPKIQALFEKYNKNKWIKTLESNWEGIRRSNIFNENELQVIKDKFLPILIDYLENVVDNVIHGDIWLRQFGLASPIETHYIFDLEDISLGPRAYDVGSIISSILQQCEYFRLKNPNHELFRVQTSEKLVEMLLTHFPFIDTEFRKEIRYSQGIRIFHELNYLLHHQPEMKWLIKYLTNLLMETLS